MDFSDLFTSDTWSTIQRGLGQAGSAFNAIAPIINTGAQLGLGLEGTRNQQALRGDIADARATLDQLFSPTGEYAQELRRQLERKDAAAGRRSQYGTRETELMANLAKQKASVLTNPQYAQYLSGENRSVYGPLGGAVGNLTGGQQQGGTKIPNTPPGLSQTGEYLANLFAPAADASIASGIGGASSALGASGLGGVGLTGAEGLSGLSGLLPGYTEAGGPTATGIFGEAPAATAAPLGGFAEGAALLPGYASTAGTGAGIFGGGLTGAAGAPGVSGLSGLLPGYTATAGTGAGTGLFGAGAAGAAEGAGAGGAASSGLGGLGATAGVALPAAVLLGGLLSMFQAGTQPKDISGFGLASAQQPGFNNADALQQFLADNPALSPQIQAASQGGTFNRDVFNQGIANTTVGGKKFEGAALNQINQLGDIFQNNPNLFGQTSQGFQATPNWQDALYGSYGGG